MYVPFIHSVSQLPPGSCTLQTPYSPQHEPGSVRVHRPIAERRSYSMLHTMKRWRARTTTTLLIERTCLPSTQHALPKTVSAYLLQKRRCCMNSIARSRRDRLDGENHVHSHCSRGGGGASNWTQRAQCLARTTSAGDTLYVGVTRISAPRGSSTASTTSRTNSVPHATITA